MSKIIDFITWWCWRRWRIYCPDKPIEPWMIDQMFNDNFTHGLFDYDEAFVPPCTLNEKWCGGFRGTWTPKIKFIATEPDERMKDE